MTFLETLLVEARDLRSGPLVASAVVTLVMIRSLGAQHRPHRERGLLFFLAMHLLLLIPAAALRAGGSPAAGDVELAALILAVMTAIAIAGSLVFTVLLPRLRVRSPGILSDVLVAGASLVAIFVLASRAGHDLTGLIATSAVLTAVIGLAMQDTLGNLIGGLALQLDDTVEVGDWIRVGDVTGKVTEIRWRYTALETRNWETVVVPNSSMVKSQVLVLGRRVGKPRQLRRWVLFNADFRHPPPEVIAAAEAALRREPIERVAQDPPPDCVLMDLQGSFAHYAIRYWLTDMAADDATDGAVRTRLYFALLRAGITMPLPAQAIHVTEDSDARRAERDAEELARRLRVLAGVDVLGPLGDTDRRALAAGLQRAPFARGEAITRQGEDGQALYMIAGGEVAVRVRAEEGQEREVARLGAGDFFGEMSLMTGEPRSATVLATTDVDCYRLDPALVRESLLARPELAADIADVLARRRVELAAAREGLDVESRRRRLEADRSDLLARIGRFFGITSGGRAAG